MSRHGTRIGLATVVAAAVLALVPAAASADDWPSSCSTTTMELRIGLMTPGTPFAFTAPEYLASECGEEPGDPRTVEISWGDGTSSAGTVAPAANGDPRQITISGTHVYAIGAVPPADSPYAGFKISAAITNGRSGHTMYEVHYMAQVRTRPVCRMPALTGKTLVEAARAIRATPCLAGLRLTPARTRATKSRRVVRQLPRAGAEVASVATPIALTLTKSRH